jgi:hypothetical protein
MSFGTVSKANSFPFNLFQTMQTLPSSSIEFLPLAEIVDLYDLGSLSELEFSNLLEKRWSFLDKKIRTCTTGDSSWNDFHAWKAEKQDVDLILEKIA